MTLLNVLKKLTKNTFMQYDSKCDDEEIVTFYSAQNLKTAYKNNTIATGRDFGSMPINILSRQCHLRLWLLQVVSGRLNFFEVESIDTNWGVFIIFNQNLTNPYLCGVWFWKNGIQSG